MSDPAQRDPLRAAMIDALYGNIANQTLGAVATSGFLAAGATFYSAPGAILAWLGVQLVLQLARLALARRYRQRRAAAEVEPWARVYLGYIILQGLLWGATMWLFVHDEEPLSVVLTLSCLYAVVCGSIPGNAYHPAAGNALMLLVFGSIVTRLVSAGELPYLVVGIASFLFLLVVYSIARTQHRVLRDGVRIRFENEKLIEQLRVKTAAAEQANLAKSQFLAAASHDLRQPLYALGLFSTSLAELKLDRGGREVVHRIQDSIGVMETAFEGLLDLSKLEAGIVQPRIEPVDVDGLFDRIGQVFRPQAIARGIDLRFRSDGETVASDPVLLEQVIGNLVSNAIRATSRGGVLLAVRRRDQAARFEIWDTGKGIAAADLERIFDDYVQLGNPERDRRMGLGLGLAIARRSVALLASRIDVASRPGRGSRFGFSQSLADARAAAAPTPAELPARALRRGDDPILLVEDDDDVRLALGDLLSRWQVPHLAVADAATGFARLADCGPFSLLVTDQRLAGDMTGVELIAAMRGRMVDPPPAVVITGEVDSPLLKDAARENIVVLHKPVQAARLRRLLGLTDRVEA